MKTGRRRGRPPGVSGEQTKQSLLAAARDLFAKHGFAGTSVRDIAGRAGVTEAALYAYFENKEALYDALYERAGAHSVVRVVAGVGAPHEVAPATFLQRLADELMTVWSTRDSRTFMSVFTRELADRRQGGVQLFESIGEAVDALAKAFSTWRALGLVRTQTADRVLAWEFFAPLVYLRIAYLQIHATKSDARTAHALAHDHVASVLAALQLGPRGKVAMGLDE